MNGLVQVKTPAAFLNGWDAGTKVGIQCNSFFSKIRKNQLSDFILTNIVIYSDISNVYFLHYIFLMPFQLRLSFSVMYNITTWWLKFDNSNWPLFFTYLPLSCPRFFTSCNRITNNYCSIARGQLRVVLRVGSMQSSLLFFDLDIPYFTHRSSSSIFHLLCILVLLTTIKIRH